jgi:hypothetical protein
VTIVDIFVEHLHAYGFIIFSILAGYSVGGTVLLGCRVIISVIVVWRGSDASLVRTRCAVEVLGSLVLTTISDVLLVLLRHHR